MNAFLTAAAFVVLIAGAAYVIHRLNIQHAERIAVHWYSAPLPGRRCRGTPQAPGGSGPVRVADHGRTAGPPRRGPRPVPASPPQPYVAGPMTVRGEGRVP